MDNVSCETLVEFPLITGLASAGPFYCPGLWAFQLFSESLSAARQSDTPDLQTTNARRLESLFTPIGNTHQWGTRANREQRWLLNRDKLGRLRQNAMIALRFMSLPPNEGAWNSTEPQAPFTLHISYLGTLIS